MLCDFRQKGNHKTINLLTYYSIPFFFISVIIVCLFFFLFYITFNHDNYTFRTSRELNDITDLLAEFDQIFERVKAEHCINHHSQGHLLI